MLRAQLGDEHRLAGLPRVRLDPAALVRPRPQTVQGQVHPQDALQLPVAVVQRREEHVVGLPRLRVVDHGVLADPHVLGEPERPLVREEP